MKDEVNQATPKYWKQVLVTIFTVYPLILISDLFLKSIFPMENFAPQLGVFFTVVIVAALMVNPVMPMVNKVLDGWLKK